MGRFRCRIREGQSPAAVAAAVAERSLGDGPPTTLRRRSASRLVSGPAIKAIAGEMDAFGAFRHCQRRLQDAPCGH